MPTGGWILIYDDSTFVKARCRIEELSKTMNPGQKDCTGRERAREKERNLNIGLVDGGFDLFSWSHIEHIRAK